jgi:hypothetical protein
MHFLDVQRDPATAARKILDAIAKTKGAMREAAKVLGVGHSQFNRWIAWLEKAPEAEVDGKKMRARIEGVKDRFADQIRTRYVEAGRLGGAPLATKKKKRRAA